MSIFARGVFSASNVTPEVSCQLDALWFKPQEARAWTGVPQQPLPSATLEETVEWLAIELERHNSSRSWPPETEPTIFPYTNNHVDDFIGLAESRAKPVTSFTQKPEYEKKNEFHLITGGSGAGKTRMGMDIRRMVAQKAVDCQDKSLCSSDAY
ncbi:hypothetical protein WJX77_011986 [Trebouxia sp. C0004]